MKEMGMIPSKITQKGPQNLLRSIITQNLKQEKLSLCLTCIHMLEIATLAQARTLVSYLLTKNIYIIKKFQQNQMQEEKKTIF